jgi:predicted DNA-binding transcriptional regulator AlpA
VLSTKLVSAPEAAEFLGLAVDSVYDGRVRQRLQLPYVRLGKRVMFRQCDLEAVIERGLEKLPPVPSEGGRVDVAD